MKVHSAHPLPQRNEKRASQQGAGKGSERELPRNDKAVHTRKHREHLPRQRVHSAALQSLDPVLRRLDVVRDSVHQREAVKEGTQRGFPEQLPRHPFFLHVSALPIIQCSLSKLRKIKHLALMLCMPSIEFPSIPISLKGRKTVDFDIGTLALAFCYFERLVLYGVGFALMDRA